MKTAMQELIDEVRKLRKNGFSVDDKYLQELLEKEKYQMMDFYIGCSKDTREYCKLSIITEMWKAQRYYNETYNQNK